MPLFNQRLANQILLNEVSDLQIDSIDPTFPMSELCKLLLLSGPKHQNTAIRTLRLKNLPEPLVNYLGHGFNYANLTVLMLEDLTPQGVSSIASTLAIYPNLQTLGLKRLDGGSTRVLLNNIHTKGTHITRLEIGALDEEALMAVVSFLTSNHQVETIIIDALEEIYLLSFTALIAKELPWVKISYTESALEILQIMPVATTLIDSTHHPLASSTDLEQNDSLSSLLSSDNVSAAANDPFDFLRELEVDSSASESSTALLFQARVETSASPELYVSSNNTATSYSSSSSSSASPSQHEVAATGNDDASAPILQNMIRILTTHNNLLKTLLSASQKRFMDLMDENAQLKEELDQRPTKRGRKSNASSVSQAGLFSSSSGAGISTLQSLNFAPIVSGSHASLESAFFGALSSTATAANIPRISSNEPRLPVESGEYQLYLRAAQEEEEKATFAVQARR